MGHRVEARIADAVLRNPRLLKVIMVVIIGIIISSIIMITHLKDIMVIIMGIIISNTIMITLLKVGIKFEFREVMNRVSQHLIRNCDKIRKRRKTGGPKEQEEQEEQEAQEQEAKEKEWTQARSMD